MMMLFKGLRTPLLLALLVIQGVVLAQAPVALAPPPQTPYGMPLSLEDAKKVAAVAAAEAAKISTPITIAILDPSGYLLYFERMANSQLANVQIAMDKARSAALFRRPTKVFQDALATGGDNIRILTFAGVLPSAGGEPIIVDGKIVGAIGVSGGTSTQDGQVSATAAKALGGR